MLSPERIINNFLETTDKSFASLSWRRRFKEFFYIPYWYERFKKSLRIIMSNITREVKFRWFLFSYWFYLKGVYIIILTHFFYSFTNIFVPSVCWFYTNYSSWKLVSFVGCQLINISYLTIAFFDYVISTWLTLMQKSVISYSFVLVAGINPKLVVKKLGMGFVAFVWVYFLSRCHPCLSYYWNKPNICWHKFGYWFANISFTCCRRSISIFELPTSNHQSRNDVWNSLL